MAETPDTIKASIKERFANVACQPEQAQKFPIGAASARSLGYDPEWIDSLPLAVTESFAGVGNPLALGPPQTGETVLDLGCGAGLDSILAARHVGPTGTVIGVDFSPEMIRLAREKPLVGEVTFIEADAEHPPLRPGAYDVVLCRHVLWAMPDPAETLKRWIGLLAPEGGPADSSYTEVFITGTVPTEVAPAPGEVDASDYVLDQYEDEGEDQGDAAPQPAPEQPAGEP